MIEMLFPHLFVCLQEDLSVRRANLFGVEQKIPGQLSILSVEKYYKTKEVGIPSTDLYPFSQSIREK